MTRLIELAVITVIMSLMAWAFVEGLDREMELRENQVRKHYMEGKIR
jgi:hypothetical protein